MNDSSHAHLSHLFILKVWRAEVDNGAMEWRGSIQHVATRETRYFREWSALLEFVQTQAQFAREGDFLSSQKNSDSD